MQKAQLKKNLKLMFCQYIFSYLTQYSRNKSSISCKKKKKKVFVCLFVFDMIAHSL